MYTDRGDYPSENEFYSYSYINDINKKFVKKFQSLLNKYDKSFDPQVLDTALWKFSEEDGSGLLVSCMDTSVFCSYRIPFTGSSYMHTQLPASTRVLLYEIGGIRIKFLFDLPEEDKTHASPFSFIPKERHCTELVYLNTNSLPFGVMVYTPMFRTRMEHSYLTMYRVDPEIVPPAFVLTNPDGTKSKVDFCKIVDLVCRILIHSQGNLDKTVKEFTTVSSHPRVQTFDQLYSALSGYQVALDHSNSMSIMKINDILTKYLGHFFYARYDVDTVTNNRGFSYKSRTIDIYNCNGDTKILSMYNNFFKLC